MRVSPELYEFSARATLENAKPRGLRPAGRGAVAALGSAAPNWAAADRTTRRSPRTDLLATPAWRLDSVAHTAERLSDCPLSLNGIAKGYIVERACDAALTSHRRACVECS